MYLKLLFITVGFVAVSFSLLAIRMLIKKGGRFPSTSVGGNKRLREMGIQCAKCEEQAKFNRLRKSKIKIKPAELQIIKN